MADSKREERARSNGKTAKPIDPNNVSPDGVSAEELHPEAEPGPSVPDRVEKAVPNDEPINVEDLPERKAEREAPASQDKTAMFGPPKGSLEGAPESDA
jgi:hypothetical protein